MKTFWALILSFSLIATACKQRPQTAGELIPGPSIRAVPGTGKGNPDAAGFPEDTPTDSEKEKHIRYIIDGIESSFNAWPFAASILYKQGGHYFHYCGGSLIRDRWVLTAAHCKPHAGDYVLLGRHDLRSGDGIIRKIERAIPYPRYNPANYDNDLALVQLAAPGVSGIPLLGGFDFPPAIGRPVTAIGWGWISPDGTRSAVLRQVTVKVQDTVACRTNYGALHPPFPITDNMICAADNGKDSCQGDSGGPLLSGDPASPSQVGIVSFGWGCGKTTYPGVYTRIDHYINWINQNAV